MTDLTTTYMGMKLKNPLVASASPMSKKVELAKRLEDGGVSAIVMYSLFEEQILHDSKQLDHFLSFGTNSFQEAMSYFPEMETYNVGPEGYLKQIDSLKKATTVPIIASLNGISSGGWVEHARRIQNAGADALELNFYYVPTQLELPASQLEKAYIQLVKDIRAVISIPLGVKLSAAFTSLPNFAEGVVQAGANGLVLFNRFIQPDFDLDSMEVVPHLALSTSSELLLPLRWIAILHGRIKSSLALTGGVHTGLDLVKSTLAGASVSMVASEFVEKGPTRAAEILSEFTKWMEENEYTSVAQMLGAMSQKAVADPAAFERGNYMKALQKYNNRIY